MATENLTKGGIVADDRFPAVLRPITDGSTKQWTPSTGTDHSALLSDRVANPDVPSVASGYISASVTGKIDEFICMPTLLDTVTKIKVHIYAKVEGDAKIQASVFVDAGWAAYADIAAAPADPQVPETGWYTKTFTGTWDQADLTALQVGLKNVIATTGVATVYAMYIEVFGSSSADGPLIIATDTTKPTNAKLKAQGWHVTVTGANWPPSGLPV